MTEASPWASFLAVAVNEMRLSPPDFWRLTFREFAAIGDGWLDQRRRKSGRLTNDELAECERVLRVGMERDAARKKQE